ncbi:hypothetical protein EV682_103309 [Iodobacter fluviatilis]|uniref:Uncharacterized protein n=2 Tax=Iodobacter fluviatilis TaxID=537 RepID=A0A377Q7G4_9NEIS|nr:hypothetical protein EV682_103309 [Iodobacter fluviatilis]STQ91204.1 Uncharacterised protein [Iodobacter fluviatilis]
MSFIESGRKPLEMICDLLADQPLARLDIERIDNKKCVFTVRCLIGGLMRVWPVSDSSGELLQSDKTMPIIQYIGKTGVDLVLVYRRNNFIEIDIAIVTASQTHFDKLIAAERRLRQINKEKKIAQDALLKVNYELTMLADFEHSNKVEERDLWAEAATRFTTIGVFTAWCDSEYSRLNIIIAELSVGGLPSSGLGQLENVYEQFIYHDDIFPLRIGRINGGYTISKVRLNVANFPLDQPLSLKLGNLIIATFTAAEMANLAGGNITLEINYPVENSTDLMAVANGASIGAVKLLIFTYKTAIAR